MSICDLFDRKLLESGRGERHSAGRRRSYPYRTTPPRRRADAERPMTYGRRTIYIRMSGLTADDLFAGLNARTPDGGRKPRKSQIKPFGAM